MAYPFNLGFDWSSLNNCFGGEIMKGAIIEGIKEDETIIILNKEEKDLFVLAVDFYNDSHPKNKKMKKFQKSMDECPIF